MAIRRTYRLALAGAGIALATAMTPMASHAEDTDHGPGTLPGKVLVSGPPTTANTGPDDITALRVDDVNDGHTVIYTAYQNGVGADGTGGLGHSTIAGYDARTGALIETINVAGKVDGLTADPDRHVLIATVNEDLNSALNIVDPETRTVTTYTYSPDPAVSGNGGTDSIAIWNGRIVVAHSNPNDTSQAADYYVTLDSDTHTAKLKPVFHDDSSATDAVTGNGVTLALTDPDTNFVMPDAVPRFEHQLATVSQGDGQIIFAERDEHGTPDLTVLNLTDNKPANVPPADGLAVATSERGWLYVVDAKAQTITRLSKSDWPAGTVFIGEASDNGNPLIGTLNLQTGVITPLGNAFVNPKGLLFLPSDDGDHEEH